MTASVMPILRELKEGLTALYGERLEGLILFGSMARGDDVPGSDVDVLVLLKGPVSPYEEIRRTSDLRAELNLRHNVLVSCVYRPSERYATDQEPLLINVRREGVPV
ncbi:MAG TPA: nucleotidyltransferase domain-containing protein [Armatimonadota bacterium]|jgi:predicted nucleotidyltransferase